MSWSRASAREVERLIAQNPDAQAELESIRRQKQAMHAAFGGVVEEAVPPTMLRIVGRQPVIAQRLRLPAWAAIAAAFALLVTGAGSGWFAGQNYQAAKQGMTFADAALGAHEVYAIEVRHPVEVAGADAEHLQKWLSKRVGVSFSVPDMTDQGYSLLGGRLLAEGDKPAAMLMYENSSKQRLTVYLASNPEKSETALSMRQVGKFVVCTWREPDMVYAFVSSTTQDEMKSLAEAAHDRFES